MSQESLPMYTWSSQEQPHATPLMHAHRCFLVLGAPALPQYTPLPTDDPERDLEKGLRATVVEFADSPPDSPTVTAPDVEAATTPGAAATLNQGTPRLSALDVVAKTLWLVRMALFFAMAGAAVAVLCSIFAFFLGFVGGFGYSAPFKQVSGNAVLAACSAGGAVLGAAIGLGGFVVLCARRARAGKGVCESGGDSPVELWVVVLLAALASAFGLALGLRVVPWAGAAAAEAGVSAGWAVAVGVWGVVLPFVPGLVGAAFSTVAWCDPMRGFCCVCEAWMTAGGRQYY